MILIILMCSVPLLGAFKKGTQEYIYPVIANKLDEYICPDCNKDLILRKGDKYRHHFAHYNDDNPCNYYNKPLESQIHKDAKMLLKSLLDNNKQIKIIRKCPNNCGHKLKKYKIPKVSDTSQIIIEHRFDYNGLKIADLAYIDNNKIVCIFEICNTHKTEEINRPEPWFEINAIHFINSINLNKDIMKNDIIKIECIRKNICDNCKLTKCDRCNNLVYKKLIILNNNTGLCKNCDIEISNRIYLNVPYIDKNKIKNQYGGKFDKLCKKWYVKQDHYSMEFILNKWDKYEPYNR